MKERVSLLMARALQLPTKVRPWPELPPLLGALALSGIRTRMQHENLHDSRGDASPVRKGRASRGPAHRWRTADGSSTDLSDREMGVADSRFGRNVPPRDAWPESLPALLEPNPRLISTTLLARREFLPARSLNLLAAAWIQFQVHGWFSHGDNAVDDPFDVPLEADDPWPAEERPMKVRRTRPDPSWSKEQGPPTYRSAVTHWWDASQVYGSSLERQLQLRSQVDGKLRTVEPAGAANPLLPLDESVRSGVDLTGWNDNYWLGLSLLHTLFAREHNAICDALKRAHPEMSDEELFQTARLVNAALMAKIHTIEWTPSLLDTPTLHLGMHANWHGALPRWMTKRLPHLGHAWSGILGSHADHTGVPYSLTEEFVTVYRMHPLVPDEYTFRSSATDAVIDTKTFTEIQGLATRAIVESVAMDDLFYSFGRSHPGQITLHNYPNSLRDFRKTEGGDPIHIDLAAIDILRDRERGIPRYNDFRARIGMPRVASFEALCKDPAIAAELRAVYHDDIDRLDTMVGMFAEQPPKGFAFSETAFRIFVLMASRRLSSDRFFTDDYRPEIYTKEGLDWVEENTMSTVLLRHFPELKGALEGLPHAFAPWNEVKA